MEEPCIISLNNPVKLPFGLSILYAKDKDNSIQYDSVLALLTIDTATMQLFKGLDTK